MFSKHHKYIYIFFFIVLLFLVFSNKNIDSFKEEFQDFSDSKKIYMLGGKEIKQKCNCPGGGTGLLGYVDKVGNVLSDVMQRAINPYIDSDYIIQACICQPSKQSKCPCKENRTWYSKHYLPSFHPYLY
jgi:hypothetical protein